MKTRTEWIVAALLVGACGGTDRVDSRAARIEPEKALIASAKRAEAEAEADAEAAADMRASARAAREVTTAAEERELGGAPTPRARVRVRPPKPVPGSRAEPEGPEPMPEHRPMLRSMPNWQQRTHTTEGDW